MKFLLFFCKDKAFFNILQDLISFFNKIMQSVAFVMCSFTEFAHSERQN